MVQQPESARVTPSPAASLVSPSTALWLGWTPPVLAVAFTIVFAAPSLAWLVPWVLGENHAVELLTFLTLLPAGIVALWMAGNKRITGGDRLTAAVFLIVGLGLIWSALEEVAYGQKLFHFATPEWFLENNEQQELTTHNLPGLQGHNSYLRMALSLAGLVGLWLGRRPRFARLATPVVLWPWFTTLAVMASIDVYVTLAPTSEFVDQVNENLTEVTEMMIGFTALLYTWLCAKRALQSNPGEPPPSRSPES